MAWKIVIRVLEIGTGPMFETILFHEIRILRLREIIQTTMIITTEAGLDRHKTQVEKGIETETARIIGHLLTRVVAEAGA